MTLIKIDIIPTDRKEVNVKGYAIHNAVIDNYT